MSARKERFVVGAGEHGTRLDQLLAARVGGLSRRKARLLLDLGGVFIDGKRTKIASRAMRAGETVEAVFGGALERATSATGREARDKDAAALPSYRVVHEDEAIVVVDKPAGLLTAPTPESDRGNLADLLARRGLAGATAEKGRGPKPAPIFVVHRIDLDTSGLLVFAKTEDANRVLSERFRRHDLDREYLAAVEGLWPDEVTRVERDVNGKHAVTHFVVVERAGDVATLLRATLETGRTHQIRVHARTERHPVLGDRLHGTPTKHDPPRMALHAARLGIEHPVSGARLDFESPLPDDLAAWWGSLRDTAVTRG